MINLVVADLLRIRTLHSRKFFLNTPILNNPDQENYMADDTLRLFYLYDTKFLIHMSVVHPQLHGSWQISLPPPEIIFYVMSMLRRKPWEP